MRIVSGNFRGKKIDQAKGKNTRPLKDLTKESIFNILMHSEIVKFKLDNSSILDLFSGVGSFGIECISRGSKKVVFCENFPETLKILKKNVNGLNCKDKVKIIEEDIFNIKNIDQLKKKTFEFIFLDPPYKEKRLVKLLEDIIKIKILKKNGIIIIHRHKKENEIYPEKLYILKIKTYGISKIIFGSVSQ